MPQPETGLILEYAPCADGAQLVRLFGDTPCPTLPEAVDGLPLTALAPYCFAETRRESALPPPEARRRVRLGPAPAAPDHPICGGFLQGVTLPDALRLAGSCAFYNCRRLEWISAGRRLDAFGSDVFLNTFALRELIIRAGPDQPSSLYRLVNNIQTDVRAVFRPGDTVLAAARYPEYWEDIQETPAHILLHNYSGQGYHYRQCFAETVPCWAEYDGVFPMSRAEDPPAVMALLCLDRLRWPHALSGAAAAQYRAFLAAHAADCLGALLQARDTDALAALLALDVLDAGALAEGAVRAARADNAAFAALLTDRLHAKQAAAAPARAKSRYDLDF